jgi:hypothetical protein
LPPLISLPDRVAAVTLGQVPHIRILGGGAAGVVAAAVWAAQEPLDIRVFGVRYSDPELLGRAVVPKGDGWRPVGLALHAANGFAFGALYSLVAGRLPGSGPVKGTAAGITEHLATWPLMRFVPRWHPAARRLPRLYGNRRAYWQSAWRHLLFGALLGTLEERLRRGYADAAPG